MTVEERLFYILQKEYIKDNEIRLSEETDLISDLELDSIDIFRVLTDVEKEFQIQFDDVDLLAERFSNLGNFCKLIERELTKKGKE